MMALWKIKHCAVTRYSFFDFRSHRGFFQRRNIVTRTQEVFIIGHFGQ